MLRDDLRASRQLGPRRHGHLPSLSHPRGGGSCGQVLGAGPPSPPWQRRLRRPSRTAAGTSPPAGQPRRCKWGCRRTWGRAAVSAARPPSPAPGWRWSCPHPAEAVGLSAARASTPDCRCRVGQVLGPYLLVECNVVQPHAHFPREEVGAVVTVPQEAPAQRGLRRRVEGVPGATQAQLRAGRTETLGAGVVVVEEAWREGPGSSHPHT